MTDEEFKKSEYYKFLQENKNSMCVKAPSERYQPKPNLLTLLLGFASAANMVNLESKMYKKLK